MNNHTERDWNQIFIEVSSELYDPYPEIIPSYSDAIAETLYLVMAFKTLASGNVRWWRLISGWLIWNTVFIFSTSSVILFPKVVTHLMMSDLLMMSLPITTSIPLFSLTRGTARKLSQRQIDRHRKILTASSDLPDTNLNLRDDRSAKIRDGGLER